MSLRSYIVEIAGKEREIQLKRTKSTGYRVKLDDEEIDCQLLPLPDPQSGLTKYILYLQNRAVDLNIFGRGRKYRIYRSGQEHLVQVEKSRTKELKKHVIKRGGRFIKGEKVICEMPGLIVKLEVKEGDRVKRGQELAVIDAMKMENEILAPRSGEVIRIEVQEGQEIDKGHLICCIK